MKKRRRKISRGRAAAETPLPLARHAAFVETHAADARLHGEELDAVREESLIGTSAPVPAADLQAEEPSDDVRVPR